MAIFKHRQTNETREADLGLEKAAAVYSGYPVPVGSIDFESILGLNSTIGLSFHRLRDGKVVLEGSRWDLYLSEEESKSVLLSDEEPAYLAQLEEMALDALAVMNVTTKLSVKDAVIECEAAGLAGGHLFVLLLLSTRQIILRDICQKTNMSVMSVITILRDLEFHGLVAT